MDVKHYECPRCGYYTETKGDYLKHFKRKHPCHDVRLSGKSVKELVDEFSEDYNNKPHVCSVCNSRYNHLSGLYRHKSKCHVNDDNCPITSTENSNNINSTNTISNSQNISNSNNNTTNSHNSTVTNITNITQNVTINLNPIGKEDLAHILQDTEFLTKCLKDVAVDGIPNLVEKIYFDPNVPQNHNVALKRIKKPSTVWVFEEQDNGEPEWREKDLVPVLDKMITKGSDILIRHNNHIFLISQPKDEELYHLRTEKLNNIRVKKKGCYRTVRDGVFQIVKDNKK
jgi:uncharacterized C2H2 Zn-finger protein